MVDEETMRVRIQFTRETDLIFSENLDQYCIWMEKTLSGERERLKQAFDAGREIETTNTKGMMWDHKYEDFDQYLKECIK